MRVEDTEFRALADNLPTLCWIAASDGYISWYNRRWYEYTGTTPEQMEGWGWQSVHDPVELPRVLERWKGCIASGQPFDMVFPLKAANGHYSPFLTRVSPAFDENGKLIRWFGVNTDVTEQVKAESERALIASELNHRIKNIFSVVAGLISVSVKSHPEATAFATDLRKRLSALSYAHDFIQPRQSDALTGQTKLFQMVRGLLEPYHDGARYTLSGDDIELNEKAVTPLALFFHELATNAAKYGAFSKHGGKITIQVLHQDNAVRVSWDEAGGPPVEEPQRYGFGSRLSVLSIESNLRGSLAYDWKREGLSVIASVPAAAVITAT